MPSLHVTIARSSLEELLLKWEGQRSAILKLAEEMPALGGIFREQAALFQGHVKALRALMEGID